MRGRVLLPLFGLGFWGAAVGCSASKDASIADRNPGGGGSAGSSAAGTPSLGGALGPLGGTVGLGGTSTGGSGGDPLPPHTACTPDMPCGDKLTCVKGVGEPDHCAPTGIACTMDTECGGDSYCCGEGCLTTAGASICIPYGYGPRGNVNAECKGEGAPPGVFAPSLQCEWKVKPTDPHPKSGLVLATPMVADLPNDSGPSAEIVFVSWAAGEGDGSNSQPGVIRIINGQTCDLVETVEPSSGIVRAGSPVALADLDADGKIDIVARKDAGGVIAFNWDGAKYKKMWESTTAGVIGQKWDGPSIHDLDDDGKPEVLAWGEVLNGQTGATITDMMLSVGFNGYIPVAGDFNGDGKADLAVTRAQEMTTLTFTGGTWVDNAPMNVRWGKIGTHFAVADFGTPGATAADFDPTKLDGIAEVVATNAEAGGRVSIFTITGQEVMAVDTKTDPSVFVPTGIESGGPPTIGDFDNDGFPEVAIAGATRFRVFDFDCKSGGAGCEGPFVRWSQLSQDASSRQTAASIFDFDGDGKAEAIYADECFLRVYDGVNGEVLFSAYRNSGTWLENPVVADVDKDQNTEIVVNSASWVSCPSSSNPDQYKNKPFVDPLHKGARCDDDMGCVSGAKCMEGYCRCSGNDQCDAGSTCVAPLAGTPGSGNVCRATHPNSPDDAGGVKVLRDRLDRWASSRPLWNQHAYSITNINDDGSIPKLSEWKQNWKQPKLNNYRANVQGAAGFADYPDITGALAEDKVCAATAEGGVTLTATVCNRGKKAVGADMPATFYKGDAGGEILCVSYTQGPVPVGGCLDVSCDVTGMVSGKVTMVVNDDGKGNKTTVECNPDNNTDFVNVTKCRVQ